MLTVRPWVIRAVSAVAIAASCWLLFAALRGSWRDVVGMLSDRSLLVPLGVSCLLYGIALGVLSNAWRHLAGTISGVPLTLRHGLSIYAIANVAKYLPGNVFHFAARQVLGRSAGQSHRAMALATVLELALMVTCSLLLIVIVGGRYVPERLQIPSLAPDFTSGQVWAALVSIVIVVGAAALAIVHKTGLLRRTLGIGVRGLVMPGVFISLFLVGQSLLAVYLGHAIGTGQSPTAPSLLIAVAYLLAWLVGLVVPGAPGGLGVREGVLLFLLGGVSGEAFTLALAVAMRFVSIAGDAMFAVVGHLLHTFGSKRNTEHEPANRQAE